MTETKRGRGRPPFEAPQRPTDEVLIAAWREADGNVRLAARTLAVPMSSLRWWLKRAGMKLRGRGGSHAKGQGYRPELADLLEEHGGMLAPIGEAMGLTSERVRQLILGAGLFERAEQLRALRRAREVAAQEAEREEHVHVGVCEHCTRTFRCYDPNRVTCSSECSRERKVLKVRKRAREWYWNHKAARVDTEKERPHAAGMIIVALCADRGEAQALLALVRDHLGADVDWRWENARLPGGSRLWAHRYCPARSSLLAQCDLLLGTCPEHGSDEGCRAFHERGRVNVANWQPLKTHRREMDARVAILAMPTIGITSGA